MKAIKLIVLVAIVFTVSCKKKDNSTTANSNSNTSSTTPPVTYGTVHIDIALVDRTDNGWSGTSWGLVRTAYITCNGNKIDSLTGLNVNTCSSSPSLPALASVAQGKDFKVQDGADNFLEIYNDGVKVAYSKIDRTNNYLNGIFMGGAPTYPDNFGNLGGGYPFLCTPTW